MHKSRLGELTIDCADSDLEAAADFWSGAFGYEATRFENHYFLNMPDGEVRINIQRVEHSPRVHLDIETDDIQAEVQRLEALGATRVRRERRWWVMEAPTGHRFCVVEVTRARFETEATRWD
jgi:predicted enzyme related to lactoylglutathione lyase